MVRKIDIYVPKKEKGVIVDTLASQEHVNRIFTTPSCDGKTVMISFVCVDKHVSAVLKCLESTGLGTSFGSLDIHELKSTIPDLAKGKDKNYRRKYRLSERRSIREIEQSVDAGLHLTGDFVLLTIVAGTVAAIGLLMDSAVTVVASMIISPMMGPIVGIAYGAAVGRHDFMRLGFRNEVVAVMICLILGSIVGLLTILFYEPLGLESLKHLTNNTELRSVEMNSRGEPIALISGFFLAFPSGCGVALATTNAGISAIVGVAISAALLPPLVNSAITMSMGIVYYAMGVQVHGQEGHFAFMGTMSFCLFLINFVTIFIGALLTFRVKGVTKSTREFQIKAFDPSSTYEDDIPKRQRTCCWRIFGCFLHCCRGGTSRSVLSKKASQKMEIGHLDLQQVV